MGGGIWVAIRDHRADRYGGDIVNRTRLLSEIVDATAGVYGKDRVGVRLSPYGNVNDIGDSRPVSLFRHVAHSLSESGIAYLHLIEPRAGAGLTEVNDASAPSATALLRDDFRGPLIASGGFDAASGSTALASKLADAIAFGRAFIANPDLPERLRLGAPLNAYDRATFYGGTQVGYTDYPGLQEEAADSRLVPT
jgi:N-ethylmaleimide reductase